MLMPLRASDQHRQAGRYLLEGLDESVKEDVFRLAVNRTYANQEYLIRQGQTANGIHVITSGTVESLYEPYAGRELILATWQAGDFVGGPYLFGDHEHLWSARALGTATALYLDHNSLRTLAAQSGPFALALIECLGFKGERYSKLAQVLATHTTTERVALLLTELARQANVAGDGSLRVGAIKPAKIAQMIGATRQSVANAFQRLEEQKIIAVEATSIRIIAPDTLADLGKGSHD